MAIKLYDDTNFIMIASAIRAKNGLETQYKPSEMATAINAFKMAKDVEPNNTSSGLNVNFKDGADGEEYNALILNIPPLQDGTGDPSPTNKRAFKHYARFILYYSGADKTDYETYTLNHSTLGGSIDLISGAESYFNISMRLVNYSNSITTYTENGVTIFYLPNTSSFGDIYSESLKTVEKMSSLSEAAQNMPNNSIAGSKGAAQDSIGFFIRADSFSTVSELIASIGMDYNYPTTWMETRTITSGLFTGRTELGVNNLWAIGYQVYDEQLSQDIPLEVLYKADPILYTQGVVMDMLPQDQVTGALANFPDGSANPIVEGIFSIVPYQEGTGDPSPSNVRPISGFTGMNVTRIGKNLCKSTSDNCISYGAYTNYSISNNVATITGNALFGFIIPVKPNTTYTARKTTSDNNLYLRIREYSSYPTEWSGSNFIIQSINSVDNISTFTTGNTTKYILYVLYRAGTSLNTTVSNMQVEVGSTATDYEAYQGVTKSVTWADSAGTVYGGSLNLTTGVLTVNRKSIDLGSLNWTATATANVFYATISDKTAGYSSDIYCSTYKYYQGYFSGMSNYNLASNSTYRYVYVKNPDCTTAEEIKQALDGVIAYYLTDDIQTIQLTPQELNTLLGTNNIYCDTGDSDIKYRADIDLYIQKKIAEG